MWFRWHNDKITQKKYSIEGMDFLEEMVKEGEKELQKNGFNPTLIKHGGC